MIMQWILSKLCRMKMGKNEKRIQAILGDDNKCTLENTNRFCSYMLNHISFPILVTGIEDFLWEEPYVLGIWDEKEYEELKKTNPSYTDTFELQDIELPYIREDITAKLKRVSDGRLFKIGLSWLRCNDKDCDAYTMLDDYNFWYKNN